jgi:hypothetical protein
MDRRPVRVQGPELRVPGRARESLVQQTDRRPAERVMGPGRAEQPESSEHQQTDPQQRALVRARALPGWVLLGRQQTDQPPRELAWLALAERPVRLLERRRMDRWLEPERVPLRVWRLAGA